MKTLKILGTNEDNSNEGVFTLECMKLNPCRKLLENGGKSE